MNRILIIVEMKSATTARLMFLTEVKREDWTADYAQELGHMVRGCIVATATEIGHLPDIGLDPSLN